MREPILLAQLLKFVRIPRYQSKKLGVSRLPECWQNRDLRNVSQTNHCVANFAFRHSASRHRLLRNIRFASAELIRRLHQPQQLFVLMQFSDPGWVSICALFAGVRILSRSPRGNSMGLCRQQPAGRTDSKRWCPQDICPKKEMAWVQAERW